MREILFRGKRKDNGEWAQGYYVRAGEKHYIFTGETGLFPVDAAHPHLMYRGFVHCEVDPETVGWFTGVCDKNGVKIFEGDFVEAPQIYLRNFNREYEPFGSKYYYVKWIAPEAGFSYCDCDDENDILALDYYLFEDIEVVGNIHDDNLEDFQ